MVLLQREHLLVAELRKYPKMQLVQTEVEEHSWQPIIALSQSWHVLFANRMYVSMHTSQIADEEHEKQPTEQTEHVPALEKYPTMHVSHTVDDEQCSHPTNETAQDTQLALVAESVKP